MKTNKVIVTPDKSIPLKKVIIQKSESSPKCDIYNEPINIHNQKNNKDSFIPAFHDTQNESTKFSYH